MTNIRPPPITGEAASRRLLFDPAIETLQMRRGFSESARLP
jgi:hypothetical protein